MDWVLANWEWIMLGFYTLEKIKNEKVFDKSVANAMANGNVEMTINKNKTMTN